MTMGTQRAIAINGATIWCESIGAGPPLVLVHAGICESRMWEPQVAAFSGAHRVVRYDLRGFGRSAIPPEPYTHHDDLRALFESLDLPPAVLVGASYGGNVATEFALEHPDRVRALILVNSLVGMETPSPGLRSGWDEVNAAADAGDLEMAIELESRMWVDGPHRMPDEVDADLRRFVTGMNAAIWARVDEQDAAEERELEPAARERFGEAAAPVLAVVGELDQPDAMTSADAIVAGVPDGRKVTIPDAAHLPSLERPEAFNRIVREFLAALQSRPPSPSFRETKKSV